MKAETSPPHSGLTGRGPEGPVRNAPSCAATLGKRAERRKSGSHMGNVQVQVCLWSCHGWAGPDRLLATYETQHHIQCIWLAYFMSGPPNFCQSFGGGSANLCV